MNFVKNLWIIFILCCQLCFTQSYALTIAPSGETTVSATLGKMKADVIFRTSIVHISDTEEKNRRFVQCTYSKIPCSLTERIRLLLDGNEVFIPRSAYSDLGDVSIAEFTMSGGKMMLTIKGGDASESYIAVLLFDKSGLLERRFYSGEDTEHPLEVSHYFQINTAD